MAYWTDSRGPMPEGGLEAVATLPAVEPVLGPGVREDQMRA